MRDGWTRGHTGHKHKHFHENTTLSDILTFHIYITSHFHAILHALGFVVGRIEFVCSYVRPKRVRDSWHIRFELHEYCWFLGPSGDGGCSYFNHTRQVRLYGFMAIQ